MKRTLLELGGKSPNIIFADADRQKALASAMSVWTFHTGQICIAGTRLLIEAVDLRRVHRRSWPRRRRG